MPTYGMACADCDGLHIHGETEDELVELVQKHAQEVHNQAPASREDILASAHAH